MKVLSENGILKHKELRMIPNCPVVLSKSQEYVKLSMKIVRTFLDIVYEIIET